MGRLVQRQQLARWEDHAGRRISGALRMCIDAHGPITKQWIGSATKRVLAMLRKLGPAPKEE